MPPAAPAGDVASQTVQKYAQDYAFAKIKTLPKRNNRTGKLGDLDRNQHPDFIYPLPNPTIHGLGAVSRLDPTKFQGLGSYVVVFAPDIYWDRHVTVCCPLCNQPAKPHGWCNNVRRVVGIQHTYYVVGRRYRCQDCAGGCCPSFSS